MTNLDAIKRHISILDSKMTEEEIRVALGTIALLVVKEFNSLKLEKGDTGEKGERGESGKDGRDGVDGKDGRDGRDGVDGLNGRDGKDGQNGKDGTEITPEQIRDKLEGLKEKLSIHAIQDLPKLLEEKESKGRSAFPSLISKRIRFIDDETPSGTIDGVNTVFTLSKDPAKGSLKVYRGGGRQRVTEDYTLSGRTITFTIPPVTGEIILCDFRY